MFPLKSRSFGLYAIRTKQGSVPFESMFANDFSFLRLLQVDSEPVLPRSMETAGIIGKWLRDLDNAGGGLSDSRKIFRRRGTLVVVFPWWFQNHNSGKVNMLFHDRIL